MGLVTFSYISSIMFYSFPPPFSSHILPFFFLLERKQKRVMEYVYHESRKWASLNEGRKRIFLTPNYPDSTTFNWCPRWSFKVPFQFSIVKRLLHLRCTPHHPNSCLTHLHRHSQPERKMSWYCLYLLFDQISPSELSHSFTVMHTLNPCWWSPVCYCTTANNTENGLPLGTYKGRMQK